MLLYHPGTSWCVLAFSVRWDTCMSNNYLYSTTRRYLPGSSRQFNRMDLPFFSVASDNKSCHLLLSFLAKPIKVLYNQNILTTMEQIHVEPTSDICLLDIQRIEQFLEILSQPLTLQILFWFVFYYNFSTHQSRKTNISAPASLKIHLQSWAQLSCFFETFKNRNPGVLLHATIEDTGWVRTVSLTTRFLEKKDYYFRYFYFQNNCIGKCWFSKDKCNIVMTDVLVWTNPERLEGLLWIHTLEQILPSFTLVKLKAHYILYGLWFTRNKLEVWI